MSDSTQHVPVNVAKPMWACPHCGHNYRDDYTAACVCAAAGPAPDATNGVVVLRLNGNNAGVFGVGTLGPVAIERDEDRTPVAHRRDLTVGGVTIDARHIDGYNTGDLAVVGIEQSSRLSFTDPEDLGGSGWIANLFGVRKSYDKPTTTALATPPTVWVGANNWDQTQRWFRPTTPHERDVLEMLTGGLLAKIGGMDRDELAAAIIAGYRPDRRSRSGHNSANVVDMYDYETGLTIARSHGAPNLIWATRWLSAHIDDVAAWHAAAIIDWAGGAEVTIPRPPRLWHCSQLPNSPGKKRLALMDDFGDDYRHAWSNLLNELTVQRDTPAIDGLGDVVTELRSHLSNSTPQRATPCIATPSTSTKDPSHGES